MSKNKKTNTQPRTTKSQTLLSLLQTGKGVSLEEMVQATGWLPHTVRAAMTGLRKKGHVIDKETQGNTTVWLIKATA